jgi:hypothetical protein
MTSDSSARVAIGHRRFRWHRPGAVAPERLAADGMAVVVHHAGNPAARRVRTQPPSTSRSAGRPARSCNPEGEL